MKEKLKDMEDQARYFNICTIGVQMEEKQRKK